MNPIQQLLAKMSDLNDAVQVRVHKRPPAGSVWACYAADGSRAACIVDDPARHTDKRPDRFRIHGVEAGKESEARVLAGFDYDHENHSDSMGEACRWAIRWCQG